MALVFPGEGPTLDAWADFPPFGRCPRATPAANVNEGQTSATCLDFAEAFATHHRPERVRTLAASLKDYPDTEVLIVGHTDPLGST